ncbi:hypothetical protein [Galactobacillus timonensis]|uniref:hypothetical protein n=1 Tax=Galactobacillus timonensis TaxID=2041840 RepID=UPI000C823808|nr:hypothetical protein [Galactobacillus timonensis]
MHEIPWDLIASVAIAALGSQWVGQFIMAKHAAKTQPNGAKIMAEINRLSEKIDALDAKTDAAENARKVDSVNEMRWKILTFDGELQRKIQHTTEEFIEIMRVLDAYETYCDSHPEYHNSRARTATAHIKSAYDDLTKTGALN